MLEVLRTQILRRDEKIKKSEVKKWSDEGKRIFFIGAMTYLVTGLKRVFGTVLLKKHVYIPLKYL